MIMQLKNKYANRSKISEPKFRQIVKLFALDLNATQISQIVDLERKTINRYLMAIRERIAEFYETESPFQGEIEVDESYFGPRRVKGKRGRGAGSKTIVFGLAKRNGKVYTEIVPDCSKSTLQSIIRGKVEFDSVIYSDNWHGYDGLVDVGYDKHYRVNHGKDEFVNGKSHINGIERFWGYAKTRMSKHRGVNKKYFYLHLKECEFRYNCRNLIFNQEVHNFMTSLAVMKFKHFLGLLFSFFSNSFICSILTLEKFVLFGKSLLINPIVFSTVPFSQLCMGGRNRF